MAATAKNVAIKEDAKPSYLAALEAKGPAKSRDNFDQSDVSVPRIKLLQGTSKEVEAYDSASPGRFWHTGLDMDLGPELKFIVCSRNKKMLLVAPLHDGQGTLARSDDGRTWDKTGSWEVSLDPKKPKVLTKWTIDTKDVATSKVTQWGSSDPDNPDSPPAATLFYDYLVILPDHLDIGPAVMSLARSQIKRAKKGLNDKIELHASAGRPMQSLIFKATPTTEQGVAGDYKNMQFVASGFASEELFNKAKELASVMQNFKVQDEAGDLSESEKTKANSDSF
jgi:hypothetical protein